MLQGWIIYLVGRGGIGKFTVAKELAQIAGCKVVDNHYWFNPIFGLIHQDGVTPLPAGIWPLTEQICGAVLETIAAHSPPAWSSVFTHTASGNPEHEAADQVTCRDISEIADRRGARRLAVRLTCAPEELVRRVSTPERRLRLQGCDTEEVSLNAQWQPFDPGWPQSITIDTSGLSARHGGTDPGSHSGAGGQAPIARDGCGEGAAGYVLLAATSSWRSRTFRGGNVGYDPAGCVTSNVARIFSIIYIMRITGQRNEGLSNA